MSVEANSPPPAQPILRSIALVEASGAAPESKSPIIESNLLP